MLVTYKEFGVARLFLNVPTLKPDSYERFLVKLKGCQQNFKERMYRVFIFLRKPLFWVCQGDPT